MTMTLGGPNRWILAALILTLSHVLSRNRPGLIPTTVYGLDARLIRRCKCSTSFIDIKFHKMLPSACPSPGRLEAGSPGATDGNAPQNRISASLDSRETVRSHAAPVGACMRDNPRTVGLFRSRPSSARWLSQPADGVSTVVGTTEAPHSPWCIHYAWAATCRLLPVPVVYAQEHFLA